MITKEGLKKMAEQINDGDNKVELIYVPGEQIDIDTTSVRIIGNHLGDIDSTSVNIKGPR